MGAQIEGIPGGPRVEVNATPPLHTFGTWFRAQREMRGISVWYVAARTKLPADRIRAIEEGPADLRWDGYGRATARALARAIGADPDEGVGRLPPRSASAARSRRPSRFVPVPWARGISLVLVLVVGGALMMGTILRLAKATGESPPVVRKTDYLDRLLGGDGS